MAKHDANRLTHRRDGRWCKRFHGVYWTSRSTDPDEALVEWLAAKRNILNGEAAAPEPDPVETPVRLIVNRFLTDRQERQEAGTMKPRTAASYIKAALEFAAAVGGATPVRQLRPEDFGKARDKWRASLGAWKLSERVGAIRTMLKWARVHRLIDFEPWYGDRFGMASAAEKRKGKRVGDDAIFTGEEIKLLLSNAAIPLRAMILLGLNGGLYAIDCADLRTGDLRQRDGQTVYDNQRRKTGVPWTFVLWPETVAALTEAQASRPKPRKGVDADHVFLTIFGRPFYRDVVTQDDSGKLVNGGEVNAISQEFDRLCDRLGIKRAGVGFGKLRHTYVTAVDDHPDQRAARRSRGHLVGGIESHYRSFTVEHLHSVSDLSRRRLLSHPGVY